MDLQFPEAAGGDLGQLVDRTVEQADDVHQQQGQVGAEGHDHFHQAVVGPGLGGDLRPAAVLGEIGDGEEDGIGIDTRGAAIEGGVDGLVGVGHEFGGGGEDVGRDAAEGERCEAPGDGGIPRQAAGDEERAAVGKANINGFPPGGRQGADGGGNFQGDAEVAGEAVAAAGGDDAQGDGRADEHAADAVDHAVAAGDQDGIDPIVNGPFRFSPAVGDVGAELVRDIGLDSAPMSFHVLPKVVERHAEARFRVDEHAHLAHVGGRAGKSHCTDILPQRCGHFIF